jgi:curved DNA-binding protein CbpA
MMNELERYYRVLDLEPGASLEEVNQAYKDLVFIWHPDRIPSDNPRLQQKAQAKLKELNDARDRLRSHKAEPQRRVSSQANTRPAQKHYYSQPPRPAYSSYQSHYHAHTPPRETYYAAHAQPNHQPKQQAPDLSGANYSGANLKEKDFSGRNLSDANLSHANLSDAFLHNVNLSRANLYRTNLFRANLLQANLSQADLREANLIGADLSGADLSGANLQGAKVGTGDRVMVKLTGARLTGAIMPDGQVHE